MEAFVRKELNTGNMGTYIQAGMYGKKHHEHPRYWKLPLFVLTRNRLAAEMMMESPALRK